MEKVKVTQEQADLLNVFQDRVNSTGMSTEAFIYAFKKGYEIKPEFKVGDWIYDITDKNKTIIEVAYVKGGLVHGFWKTRLSDIDTCVEIENAVHLIPSEIAKEKERRWWKSHGRDVQEFKVNDIISHDSSSWGGIYIVYDENHGKDAFGDRLIPVFNNRMHDGRVLSFKAKELKVICFAEDRKDVDHD